MFFSGVFVNSFWIPVVNIYKGLTYDEIVKHISAEFSTLSTACFVQ